MKLKNLKDEHVKERAEMNKLTDGADTYKRKRDDVLAELDLECDDFTEEDESINEDDDTIEDADEIDALLNEVERIREFIY
jgi:hypothetical protein